MARLTLFISLSLALSSIPGGHAGPACAKKHYQVADCVSICKSKWGWSGSMMGTDPWGSVVKKVDTNKWNAVVSEACGTPVASPATSTAVASTSTALQTGSVIPTAVVTTPSTTSSATRSTTSAISGVSSSSSHSPSSSVSAQGFLASARRSSTTVTVKPTTVVQAAAQRPTSTSTKVETAFTTLPPATKAATTKASQPTVVTGSSGGTSNADIQAYLAGHNIIRAQHGASPLTWSDNLAAKAQQWANGCKFQHSGGSLGPFGENLAAGTGSGYGIPQAIKDWTDEVSEYNPSNPVPSHFTQVVWKASTQVGCAVQTCNGIFDTSFGPAKYYVCEYSVQGNVIGQFAQNVQV